MNPFEQAVRDALKTYVDERATLEIPPDSSLGDYAFPCFTLAKTHKKNPVHIAQELAKAIKIDKHIERIEAKGPYLNFFVNRKLFIADTLKRIDKEKEKFGSGKKKKERFMVEFCQVNTHKAFHVGHLRGTLLGQALVNILGYYGYPVKGVNYQGDIGAHVAKVIWYLDKFKETPPKEHKGTWLGQIYQKAHKMIEEKAEYKEEVSGVLQKLESKYPDLTKIWEETRKYSLDEYEEYYQTLGIHFDEYFFESEMEKPGKKLVDELIAKGVAEEDDGAIIIKLGELGNFLLLKSNGTALYSTKDLALAKIKFEKFKIDYALYCVGSEQKLYFQQLFKTLEIMGFPQAKYCSHIPYELVTLQGGKISSREGELLLLHQLLDTVINLAAEEVKKRHPEWNMEKIKENAEKIGLAALKFTYLAYDNNKTIMFDIEKAMRFEGETGPYLQYVYARIQSILSQAPERTTPQHSLLQEPEEYEICKKMMRFEDVVKEAATSYKPHLIARYLIDLTQTFNEYYHKHRVLGDDQQLTEARLCLIEAVQRVLANGLSLLGIATMEQM